MKVEICMENLNTLVEEAMNRNIENVIKQEIDKIIVQTIEKQAKEIVSEVVNMKMTEFVEDYISKATITVGGGFYSKEEAKTYTVEQYIKQALGDLLETKTLKIKRNDRYSDGYDNVSFEDFIKKSFNPNEIVEKKLMTFINETKQDINNKINDTFTNVTKNMLSETVFNVLMKNDTFVQLNDSIKCLADK